METQRQFEFCHRVLEELLWGAGEGGEGGGAKKSSRWKKFSSSRKKSGEWWSILERKQSGLIPPCLSVYPRPQSKGEEVQEDKERQAGSVSARGGGGGGHSADKHALLTIHYHTTTLFMSNIVLSN